MDRRCEQVCLALRSVTPDSEGYLPRDAVFGAAKISVSDLIPPGLIFGGGTAPLHCGCWLEFAARDRPTMPNARTIDEFLNYPNRSAWTPSNQLEFAVLIDSSGRELCRLESAATRRKRAAQE